VGRERRAERLYKLGLLRKISSSKVTKNNDYYDENQSELLIPEEYHFDTILT
jgi:hypothetical protein